MIRYPEGKVSLKVKTICEDIIEEWEEWSGGQETFTSYSDHGYLEVGHLEQKQGVSRPNFIVTDRGSIYQFKLEDSIKYMGVRFLFGGTDKLINCWYLVEEDHDDTQSLSLSLGIEDILNIQPHEYGYLKLKYGLTRELLFIPTIVKDQLLKA